MTDKDFRYTLPDGTEVEGFQLTEQTRYREKDWPDWMDSRFLITYEGGEQRLIINDAETVIPKFGWIVKYPGNAIKAVDYTVMEEADKVVKEVQVVVPEQAVDEEGLLVLASKISGKSVEELRAAQEAAALASPAPPAMAAAEIAGTAPDMNRLIAELTEAYALLANNGDGGLEAFRNILAGRVVWCNCSPGQCSGGDRLGCRQNSPLVQ